MDDNDQPQHELTVVPKIADRQAYYANMLAIDSIVRSDRYPFIVAWGKWLGFTPETVLRYVQQAVTENAPDAAIQNIDGKWLVLDDIQNDANRSRVVELAIRPAYADTPANDEKSLT